VSGDTDFVDDGQVVFTGFITMYVSGWKGLVIYRALCLCILGRAASDS